MQLDQTEAVYTDEYISSIRAEASNLKDSIRAGEQPVFSSVDDLLESLEDRRLDEPNETTYAAMEDPATNGPFETVPELMDTLNAED